MRGETEVGVVPLRSQGRVRQGVVKRCSEKTACGWEIWLCSIPSCGEGGNYSPRCVGSGVGEAASLLQQQGKLRWGAGSGESQAGDINGVCTSLGVRVFCLLRVPKHAPRNLRSTLCLGCSTSCPLVREFGWFCGNRLPMQNGSLKIPYLSPSKLFQHENLEGGQSLAVPGPASGVSQWSRHWGHPRLCLLGVWWPTCGSAFSSGVSASLRNFGFPQTQGNPAWQAAVPKRCCAYSIKLWASVLRKTLLVSYLPRVFFRVTIKTNISCNPSELGWAQGSCRLWLRGRWPNEEEQELILLAVCKYVICLSRARFHLSAFENRVSLPPDPAYLTRSVFS